MRTARAAVIAGLVMASALGGCGGSGGHEEALEDARTLLGDDRRALFDAYVDAIRSVQLVSTDGMALLGTTWDRELSRTQARFLGATTASDVYYALLSLKNSYHDAHSTFFPEDAWHLAALPSRLVPEEANVVLPIDVRVEYENGSAVYRAVGAGIDAGSTIVSMSGVPMGEVEDQLREWYPLHSLEGLREFVASSLSLRRPRSMPSPRPGERARLSLTHASGEPYEVTLTWESAPSASAGSGCARFGSREAARDYAARAVLTSGSNYCVYDGGAPDLRVVRYFSFLYDTPADMLADETALMGYLRAEGVRRVLFDVRENGGGATDPAFIGNFASSSYAFVQNRLYFAPILRSDPGRIADVLFVDSSLVPRWQGELASEPAATFSSEAPMICRTAGCPTSDATYSPSPDPIRAVVLTGPACVSACDEFVSVMRDNEIAKLAGMPSAGADSPRRYWTKLSLADGESFDLVLTVAVSDRPGSHQAVLEAHPPEIDFPVLPTPSNRGGYLDAVLREVTWPP